MVLPIFLLLLLDGLHGIYLKPLSQYNMNVTSADIENRVALVPQFCDYVLTEITRDGRRDECHISLLISDANFLKDP